MYIVVSKIRRLAREKGKRVAKSFLLYLDRRVEQMVLTQIGTLGSRKTLNLPDAEAVDALHRATSRRS